MQSQKHKNAFSFLELCLILGCVGILAGIMLNNSNLTKTPKNSAKSQIISILQTARNLALSDDRAIFAEYFCQSDNCQIRAQNELNSWDKSFWAVQFGDSDGLFSYWLYNDRARNTSTTNYDGKPAREEEWAKDALDNQFIGIYSQSSVKFAKGAQSAKYHLQREFGITKATLSGGCEADSSKPQNANPQVRLLFGRDGFLHCRKMASSSAEAAQSQTKLSLFFENGENFSICIESSGFIHECP